MTRLPKALIKATTIVLTTTAIASAAETPRGSTMLAGGPIFANAENFLYCEFINFGTTDITPTSQQLFENFSTTAVSSSSSCANDTPIAPGQTCFFAPNGSIGVSMSCKVTFSTAATNVRGALELYDSNGNVVGTVELR